MSIRDWRPTSSPSIDSRAIRRSVDSCSFVSMVAMPVDEHQVSDVDDETCALSDDENRVTTVNRVDGGHDSAGQREVPEHDRDVAGLLTLGGDPLNDEA